MLLGKEAGSEASVGGKPEIRVSLQECPTGLVPQGTGGDSSSSGNHIFGEAPGGICYNSTGMSGFLGSKRETIGWLLEKTFNGRMLANIEEKDCPSKWITWRAWQALQVYEETV
jgi:hypothetical protein